MLRRLEDRIRDLCAKAVVTIAQFLPQKLSRKRRVDRVDSLYSGCQQISGARYTNPVSRKLARRFASSWELVFQSPLFFSQQARDFSSECQQLCRVLFLGGQGAKVHPLFVILHKGLAKSKLGGLPQTEPPPSRRSPPNKACGAAFVHGTYITEASLALSIARESAVAYTVSGTTRRRRMPF